MREVLALIDSGVASPEDIDVAVRYSFGFRYAAIGPLLQKEISGWDTFASAAREIFPTLSNSATLPDCVERLLATGKLGMKSGAGFIAWTPETAAAVCAGYDERLVGALRLLEQEPPAATAAPGSLADEAPGRAGRARAARKSSP